MYLKVYSVLKCIYLYENKTHQRWTFFFYKSHNWTLKRLSKCIEHWITFSFKIFTENMVWFAYDTNIQQRQNNIDESSCRSITASNNEQKDPNKKNSQTINTSVFPSFELNALLLFVHRTNAPSRATTAKVHNNEREPLEHYKYSESRNNERYYILTFVRDICITSNKHQ